MKANDTSSLLTKTAEIATILAGLVILFQTADYFFSARYKLSESETQLKNAGILLEKEIKLRQIHFQEMYINSKIKDRTDTLFYRNPPDTLWYERK